MVAELCGACVANLMLTVVFSSVTFVKVVFPARQLLVHTGVVSIMLSQLSLQLVIQRLASVVALSSGRKIVCGSTCAGVRIVSMSCWKVTSPLEHPIVRRSAPQSCLPRPSLARDPFGLLFALINHRSKPPAKAFHLVLITGRQFGAHMPIDCALALTLRPLVSSFVGFASTSSGMLLQRRSVTFRALSGTSAASSMLAKAKCGVWRSSPKGIHGQCAERA